MDRTCCVISKQHVTDENLAYLCLGSETSEVEEPVCHLIGYENRFLQLYRRHVLATGQRKSQRALFDAAANFKWLRGSAIELYCSPRVSVETLMLCSLGEQPISGKTLKRPSLLIRSNDLVRSLKAMYMGICCSLHFSCNCRTEKTMSTVDRLARKPHCESGQIRSASFWRRISMTGVYTLSTMLSREMPL